MTNLNHHKVDLDIVRGVAVSLVLLSHADAYKLMNVTGIHQLNLFMGNVGVYLFFVLSGFLIWGSAKKLEASRGSWVRVYFINRITRIYPLYIFAIAAVFLLQGMFNASEAYLAAFKPNFTLHSFVRHLLFAQDLYPSVSRDINPVFWSLTYEFIFYLLVPALLLFVKRRFIFFTLSIPSSLITWIFLQPVYDLKFFMLWPLFAFGILLQEFNYKLTAMPAAILLICSVVMKLLFWNNLLAGYAVGIAIFMLFISHRLFSSKIFMPVAFLGVVSYSIYIWHYLIIEVFGYNTIGWSEPFWRGVLFLLITVWISYLSYRYIEQVSMTKLRQLMLRFFEGHRAKTCLPDSNSNRRGRLLSEEK